MKCKICNNYETIHINNFENHLIKKHKASLDDYFDTYCDYGIDYVICPFCGVSKRNLIVHLNYYHKEEYEKFKKENPAFKPYIQGYEDKMKDSANKRWTPSNKEFLINSLNEGKDLSLSISNPNYDAYVDELKDWAKDKLLSAKRTVENLTNWKNQMIEYEGNSYRSIYEYNTAVILNKYNIKFNHEDKLFPYYFNKKFHFDVTDFYIPVKKLIIEVKDNKFYEYIKYREESRNKLKAKENAIRKAGYYYELVHNEEILIEILSKYNLINN